MQYRAWYNRTYLGQVFVSVTILAQGLDKAALATTGAPTLRVPRCHRAGKGCKGNPGKSYEAGVTFVPPTSTW